MAEALHIPVNRLADLSVLLGNDYSSHLWEQMQNLFLKKLAFLGDPMPDISHILEFIQTELKSVPLEQHKVHIDYDLLTSNPGIPGSHAQDSGMANGPNFHKKITVRRIYSERHS